jgi:hypothetical protein
MATWDSIRMAQQFLRRSNALNPEQAKQEGRYEEELAHQELLDECYMSSFSKPKLMEMLQNSINGNIKMPEDLPEGTDFNVDRYRKAFIALAKDVLGEVDRG